jgi:CMP-N-acetylneuraminic acid synthetase
LIYYTIDAALQCKYISKCYVSTDDDEIRTISRELGATTIDRPSYLASDGALSRDVVRHTLEFIKDKKLDIPSHFVLLQPTSPLRDSRHLTQCIEEFACKQANSAVSITECEHHPYKCLEFDSDGNAKPIKNWSDLERPRQSLPKAYRPNGAIYLSSSDAFLRNNTFFIPPIHFFMMTSEDSIDIDVEEDLHIVEEIMRKRINR